MRKESISNSIPEEATAAISAAHLLHPAKHFEHPRDVLAAPGIGKQEKRAILASWASDIFAVESAPALRLYPGSNKAVSYDEIIEALKALDEDGQRSVGQDPSGSFNQPHRRQRQTRGFGGFGLCSYRKGDRRPPPLEI
ncbi:MULTISPECIES: hypothetical protein [Rhizobium]|uniref:Uncharacterized protein n=1 Tax=Rhizobium paranaense TaxID=1650438 RepID=A0A7W8XY04_9HYPH|nr:MULTISPECIES: hypothetical protein [Rhizobium]MBB5577660.1 hypothetical protein [Rhizobium paranaense]PST64038.1 hypothetical protein C9E91_04970 [Rhizobium sp. SEMIA4064]